MNQIAELLTRVGLAVRHRIQTQRLSVQDASSIVERTAADTIFNLDRHVEDTIVDQLLTWPPECLPVGVYAEGFPNEPFFVGGPKGGPVKFWLLIDPIDGTRGLMYEKRSAYFLACAAPGTISKPRLSDAIAAAAVELPIEKQGKAAIYQWCRDHGLTAIVEDLVSGSTVPIRVQPSKADTLHQGFGSVVAYFPQGKMLAAELAETIARKVSNTDAPTMFFDDQYVSSGGQLIEILTGRDRFILDLRPIFALVNHMEPQLCAHPYDLAIVPLARAGGVIITHPDGSDFDAPFAINLDVAWCGYANQVIRGLVEPLVVEKVREVHAAL